MQLPQPVRNKLLEFLSEIPVEKFSDDWKKIQVAIAMITTPSSFKKGVHVYLDSTYRAYDDGCQEYRSMSIKIYPHKITMRRIHSEFDIYTDKSLNQTLRYIYPNEKYGTSQFDEVMEDLYCLFEGNYIEDSSGPDKRCGFGSHFTISTNIK